MNGIYGQQPTQQPWGGPRHVPNNAAWPPTSASSFGGWGGNQYGQGQPPGGFAAPPSSQPTPPGQGYGPQGSTDPFGGPHQQPDGQPPFPGAQTPGAQTPFPGAQQPGAQPPFPGAQPQFGPPQPYSQQVSSYYQTYPQRRRSRSSAGVAIAWTGIITAFMIWVYSILVDTPASGDQGEGGNTVDIEYQNESYQPPDVTSAPPPQPFPESQDEAVTLLSDNPYYNQELPAPIRCDDLPGTTESTQSDIDALERRQQALVECLVRAVGPSVEAAGFTPITPEVTAYLAGSEVVTGCGTQPSLNAFYCPVDQTIYVANDVTSLLPNDVLANDNIYDLIIAHEFGHATQDRIGVLSSMTALQNLEETEAEALVFSRRSEAQADCWANMGLTTVRQDLGFDDGNFTLFAEVAYNIGDDVLVERAGGEYDPDQGTHGTGDTRRTWSQRGANQSLVETCNSWSVDESEVR